MQAVNLLPAYARPGARWATVGKDIPAQRVLTIGGIAAGAVAIALGAAYAYERNLVNDKKTKLNDDTARLTAVTAQAAPLKAAQAALDAQLASVNAVSQSRIPWEIVLRNLSRVLPSQVTLTTLSATTPLPAAAVTTGSTGVSVAAPATGTPTGFTMNGVASSQVRVALILDRLALVPWLSDVSLATLSRGASATAGGTSSGDTFSINATFNAIGGGGQ